VSKDFNSLNPNLIYDFNDFVSGGLGISSVVLSQNPLLYYRFQEDAGTSVEDSSGNSNTGTSTATGITREQSPPTAEATDSSYLFDGVNGFITTPTSSPSLSSNFSALSVECWLRVPFLPAAEQTIVGKGQGPGNDHFQLALAPDGRIKFWFSDNTFPKLAFSASTVLPNSWVYVVAVWDGTENVVYLNTSPGTPVANAVNPVTSAQNIQVAAYNSGGRFNGFLDDLAIYGTALAQEDTQDRYVFDNSNNTIPIITATTANAQGSGTLNIFQGDTVTFVTSATDLDGDTLQYLFSPDGFVPSIGPQLGNSTSVQYTETGVFNPTAFVTDAKSNRAAPFPRINVDPIPDLRAFNNSYATSFRKSVILRVLQNDTFPVGGGGSILQFTQPPGGAVVLQGSGEAATLLYTPDTDFSGIDTFTYTITDGGFGTSLASVTVDVEEKQPPTTQTYTLKVEPNSTDNIVVPQSNDRSDPSGEVLTLLFVQTPTDVGGTAVLDVLNNRVLYTPPTDFLGSDSFSYSIEDEAGLTAIGQANVTVETLVYEALNDSISVLYEESATLSVLNNDPTPFPDVRTIDSITQPPVGEGVATITGGGTTVTYDAAGTGFFGNTSFTYTSTDGTRSDTATVLVNVIERPPRALSDRLSTELDTPVSLDVLGNDSDPEGLPLLLFDFTQPSNGTVTREENGTPGDQSDDTLLYSPDLGFEGIDTFFYTIEDFVGQQATTTCSVAVGFLLSVAVNQDFGPVTENFSFSSSVTASSGYDKSYTYFWDFKDGSTSTQKNPTHLFVGIGVFEVECTVRDSYGVEKTASVQVEVIANTRPVANDISTEVAEGKVLNFDPRVNDFDIDGDQFFIVTADVTSAQGGTVFLNNNNTPGTVYDDFITYNQPALPTPFVDSFGYTIEDEFGLQDSATVTVTVLQNLPPVADSVFVSTIFEESILIDVVSPAVDPEGDDITVQGTSSISSGSASVVLPDRKLIQYTPSNGFLGTATFDFTILDDFANTDQDQATVAVFGQFYPKRVVQDEPISFYNFNEPDSQGRTAYDVRPISNHGNYVNRVLRDGQLGPLAKDLENSANVEQGYVTINTTPWDLTDQFTLEFWVRVTAAGTSSVISPIFTVTSSGQIYQFTLTTDEGSASVTFNGLEINEWYYFGITYNGAFLQGYLDLELVTSVPLTGNLTLPSIINPGLGMAGKIAALAIYDQALTLSDFEAHYAEAVGPITSYEVTGPEFVAANDIFLVQARSRDVTGKRVITNSTEEVTFATDDPAIEFDGDGDGTYNEP